MTTPRLGAPELTAGQAVPETTVNEQIRYLESGTGHFVLEDRDLSTPPGSPVDGTSYLVAASPTGAWSGQAGKIAYRLNTAWVFITVREGFTFWVSDENVFLVATSVSTFEEFSSSGSGTVTSQAGTSYTAVLADKNSYIRFTSGSAVSFTIPPNASVAFPIGTVIEFEQGGAGAVSVVAGAGVTINSRSGDLTLAGQYSVAFVKKVATNTWTLNGDL